MEIGRITRNDIVRYRKHRHEQYLLKQREENPKSLSDTCASPKCAMTAEAGGRNVDRMQQPCCMEDGGRPSGGGLQDQPSNCPALRGDKLPGGKRFGKRRA